MEKARAVEGVIQTEGASRRENTQKRGKRLKENSQQLTELCRGVRAPPPQGHHVLTHFFRDSHSCALAEQKYFH